MEAIPNATGRRPSSANTLGLFLFRGGSGGRLIHCQASASRPSGTTRKNAPRQPDDMRRESCRAAPQQCRDGVARIQHGERLGNHVFRNEAHDDRRRHRPEAADSDAQQGAAHHQECIVRGEGYSDAGDDEKHRESGDDDAPVNAAREAGDQEAGHNREHAGNRDGLARQPFSDAEIGRDRGQKAYRHELGGNQDGDA